MKQEFDLLAQTIRKNVGSRELFYQPNPGNLGDALIRIGTEKFFREYGFTPTYILPEEDINAAPKEGSYVSLNCLKNSQKQDAVLLWGGGGAWCDAWKGGLNSVVELSKQFHHIIVLPSTYALKVDIPKVTFFSRDIYESRYNVNQSIFCHDMAFFLNPLESIKEPTKKKAFCFRKDKESGFKKRWRIPLENVDISWMGNYLSSVDVMFEHLQNYEEIHTDRLHVSIACCLLGIKVYLYPNSYFKNHSIFMSSMQSNFSKVYWRNKIPLQDALRNSLQRRFKIKFYTGQ